MYPIDRRLPGGQRLRAGEGAGVELGGKRVVNKFEDDSSSTWDTGVTLGASGRRRRCLL